MGLSSSCCQKFAVTLSADSRVQEDDEGLLRDQKNDTAEGLENQRAGTRKGAEKRIGAISRGKQVGEEHLVKHKRARNKGKKTQQLLKQSMKENSAGAFLDETELDMIQETMEYFEFGKGDIITKQGDIGTTFFILQHGSLEVSVNGNVCNTVTSGKAFGGLALLYNTPRTATVKALEDSAVWGASGDTFRSVLQDNSLKRYAENREFLDSIQLFDGLTGKQKDRVGEALITQVSLEGARVVTEKDLVTQVCFVKKGELQQCRGGTVKASGELVDGVEIARLGPGDCIGVDALKDSSRSVYDSTVVSATRSELLTIATQELKEVLGDDVGACLEQNFILSGLKKSPIMSQFSSSQQQMIVKAMDITDFTAGKRIPDGTRFVTVIGGKLGGLNKDSPVSLERGACYEDGILIESGSERQGSKSSLSLNVPELTQLVAGGDGARLGILTKDGLANALKELGLSAIGSAEEASDYTRKMGLAKKSHIFRHLSEEQTTKLVKSFVLQRYRRGAHVIKQGEVGSSFFVIAKGEVKVLINGETKRTLGKNATFGERALLFDEPRSATIEVVSNEAELWSIEKSTFSLIVKGNMQQELMHRISLQDTNISLKDIRQIKVIGQGAAGVVRLVQHKKTQTKYALKRVNKVNGNIPDEVKRECDLLAENDHPFIMALLKTFETEKSVYILTELITGGELHSAIREVPTMLSRTQAQFYTGSLIIILEGLYDRNIVYRDLKPENVMLDQQGYLKLIDFGIAKKIEEGKTRTFTMIGTPHYMAPEVMRGHGYSTEVDLWSLGVMLFEFVCGFLPFADDCDDATAVCTAVLKDNLSFPARYKDQHGRTLISGLLCRQPKKRLGAGISGYEDVKSSEYLKIGHSDTSLFNKIMGRELDPPVIPKGETYSSSEDMKTVLSDDDVLG